MAFRHLSLARRSGNLASLIGILGKENFVGPRCLPISFRVQSTSAVTINTTDYANEDIFGSRETSQLWRSLFILKASSMATFVNYSDSIFLMGRKLIWGPLFDKIMLKTFYGHFAAGVSIETSQITVDKLKESGIRTMLMVPIECLEFKSEAEEAETLAKNFNSINDCIKGEAKFEDGGFSQMKLTALCTKKLMLEVNKHLLKYELNHDEPGPWNIQTMANHLINEAYDQINLPELGEEMNGKFRVLLRRINDLAQACKENNVRMMIDAEQTYLQAALGYLVLVLQAKYNKEDAIVYNTYQCFRKDTLGRIQADCRLGEKLGFKVCGKLVRGAYMIEERRLAKEGGYEDPICESFQATTDSYHACVDFLLPLVAKQQAGIMIASHNEHTVDFVKSQMTTHGIPKDSKYLCFGQILGMCDHVSYSLAGDGYLPFKSVPFGPIDDTILYLARRAQENKSVMERTKFERRIISSELKRRLTAKSS